jgi:hypothetical protein
MPPKRQEIQPPAAPPTPVIANGEARKVQSATEFMDKLQDAVTALLDSDAPPADKLKAITAGIALAKVRHGIDEEDDDGMGFAQR